MPDQVPHYYANAFNMTLTPWDIACSFYKGPPARQIPPTVAGAPPPPMPPNEALFDLNMSYEHAKLMAMQIHRSIKRYETDVLKAPIAIHPEVLKANDIDVAKEW